MTIGPGSATVLGLTMNAMIKSAVVALMLLIPAASQAGPLEDGYLAARDRYIAKLSARKIPEGLLKEEETFHADLEQQLRRIIGPIQIKNFPAEGKSNLSALSKGDMGFGQLDGLVYASDDGKTRIVVTNDVLFGKWLRAHRNWWERVANVPQKAEEALKSDIFFTQALEGDAAVSKSRVLPITKPAGASFAFAMQAGRSQDGPPSVSDEIIVTVIQGAKIFVVSAPAGIEIKSIAACWAIRRTSEKKAKDLFEAWVASGRKDEKLSDSYSKTLGEGETAFRRCFGEHIKKAEHLPALTAQAQALADILPAK